MERGPDAVTPPAGKRAPRLRPAFADLHVHLGSARGRPIKISASRELTLRSVVAHSATRTGIDMLGVIDLACRPALADLEEMLHRGELAPIEGGGFAWRAAPVVLIPGAEVEVAVNGRPAHWLAYFPGVEPLRAFAAELGRAVANPDLSTQRARWSAAELVDVVAGLGGLIWPAHAFTPHKGLFGACVERFSEALDAARSQLVPAIELGLSADTALADRLPDVWPRALLCNSDAHSTATLAREYNELLLAGPSFAELALALGGRCGRRIMANYGLDPRLGKYYRTRCLGCGAVASAAPPVRCCPACGSTRITPGVLDRIEELARRAGAAATAAPPDRPARPPYRHQVPLRFLPGLGPRTLDRLLDRFGTEMAVLHRAPIAEIAAVASEPIAAMIGLARGGALALEAGGGGRYGRVLPGTYPLSPPHNMR